MSGGVDSSVAAAILAREGSVMAGFSMHLVDHLGGQAERFGRCCSPDDFHDARTVAERLGFPHFVLHMEKDFREHVLDPFVADYAHGRTPSPCVRCNTYLKFGVLLARARAIGAGRVATGHYAILEPDPRTGRTLLRQAADPAKDQSYFLFDLSEAQRRGAVFPLGGMRKGEVREIARSLGLANAEKPESMDLCFVREGEDYRALLRRLGAPATSEAGDVSDGSGRVLAHHAGIVDFTVGQRRGLGVSGPRPLYVTRIDAAARRVVVGAEDELLRDRCTIERTRWIPFERPGGALRGRVKIRGTHAGAMATVHDAGDGKATIRFDEPQRAIAPGQAAVAYDGDLVLGGGWIATS
jgi:tRNA-specific 2-thiouridylase